MAPFPFKSVLVKDADGRADALKRAATRTDQQQPATPTSGSTSLKEIRSDLRRLKSATIQPGAVAITAEQAAARLGCSRSRVFEFLKAGRLRRAPRAGRLTMLALASVDQLLEGPPEKAPTRERRPRRPLTPGAIKSEVMALKDKYR